MKKASKKILSALLPIPLFFVFTFCCCLEKDASAEKASMEHHLNHQKLVKSHQHSEHQHQHSEDQDECACPKHFSFLSEQPFELALNLSLFQLSAKNFLAVGPFEIVISFSSLAHSPGPPWSDHRDQVSISLFLNNPNLRI